MQYKILEAQKNRLNGWKVSSATDKGLITTISECYNSYKLPLNFINQSNKM